MMLHADGPPVPRRLVAQHSAWSWSAVSVHGKHSVMYRLAGSTGEKRFLKLTRTGWIPSACAEAQRLRWLRSHAPVPEVLEAGADDRISWVLTAQLPGRDATHPAFRSDARGLVTQLARGLLAFHEVPPESCPFQFRLDDALRVARQRLEAGRIDPVRDFHREHEQLTASEAVAELVRTRPAGEDLVVCHGDYCMPNVLIDGGGVVGYVDVGEVGVADRWWDLAVATWSLTWNVGPGFEEHFLNSYGIAPDDARIRFYRLLYDVVS